MYLFLSTILYSILLLSYLTAVWGNTFDYLINKLQIAQNKFLKCIFNLPIRSPTVDLYTREPNIIPVRGMYIIQVCCFIYRYLSNQTHTNTSFELSSHQHSTRIIISLIVLMFPPYLANVV